MRELQTLVVQRLMIVKEFPETEQIAMRYQVKSPVLLVVFNRPYETEAILDVLKRVGVRKLYVVADAPRPGKRNDPEACAKTLELFKRLDWQCEVHLNVNSTNRGSYATIPAGIDWFFTQEEAGIILEDDCFPSESFFRYCDVLLEQYWNDSKIMWINGSTIGYQPAKPAQPYLITSYAISWGWATWSDSWKNIRASLYRAPEGGINYAVLRFYLGGRWRAMLFWRWMFKASYAINNWDYRALYGMWEKGGIACAPPVNLVKNVGAGGDSMHGGTGKSDPRFNIPAMNVDFAFDPIEDISASADFDTYLEKHFHRVGMARAFKAFIIAEFPWVRTLVRRLWRKAV